MGPNRLCLVAGVVAWLCIGAGAAMAQAPPAPPTIPEQVDKVFERWAQPNTPGCAVGVAQQGRTVYTHAYGMASLEYGARINSDTVFESGSVAKQFTAAAVLLLAQDGRLSLDDPVRKYVPEVPDFGSPILIRHLLTHTSGLRSQWSLMTLAGRPAGLAVHTVPEIVELVSGQKELNFVPGEEFLYNNTGFTLLSVVVQRVSGKSFAEFCLDRLFKPLGMKHTQWRDDFSMIVPRRATAYRLMPDGTFRTNMSFTSVVGNGGLLTTIEDLLRWNENLDKPRVEDRAWTQQLQVPGHLNDGTSHGYALGLFVQEYRGVREVSHGGSTAGYQTFLGRFPDQRVSVAVLCNTTGTSPALYAHQVADVLLRDVPKPVPGVVKAIDVAPAVLERVAGLYHDVSSGGLMRVAWDKEGKTLRVAGDALTPIAPGVLSSADGTRTLTLDAGPVAAAWPDSAPPRALIDKAGSTRALTWRYEPPVTLSVAQLAEFASDYASEELGVVYHVFETDGRLVVRFRPVQQFVLAPAFTDGFEAEGNTIHFTRDAAGHVDGMRIWAGRARHVRFVRQ